jgi:hypothetical protein
MSFIHKIGDDAIHFTYNTDEENWNISYRSGDKLYEYDTDFAPYLKTCLYKQVYYLIHNFTITLERVENKFMLSIDFILGDTIIIFTLENKLEKYQSENYELKANLLEVIDENTQLKEKYSFYDKFISINPMDNILVSMVIRENNRGTPREYFKGELKNSIFERIVIYGHTTNYNNILNKYTNTSTYPKIPFGIYLDGSYYRFGKKPAGINKEWFPIIQSIIDNITVYDNCYVTKLRVVEKFGIDMGCTCADVNIFFTLSNIGPNIHIDKFTDSLLEYGSGTSHKVEYISVD